eukprot:4943997-Amphidinium_carterae.1
MLFCLGFGKEQNEQIKITDEPNQVATLKPPWLGPETQRTPVMTGCSHVRRILLDAKTSERNASAR